MPARDIFHQPVVNALSKEGWRITDDPYWIKIADMVFDPQAEEIHLWQK